MMKKKVLRILLALVISAVSGFILITAVYAIPKGRMVNNIIRSHALLESEGNYRFWASDITKTQSDNFSDSLMADIAVNPGKGSLLYDAMINAYMGWEDTDNASEWLLRETGGEPLYPGSVQVVYGRYWHGYLLWMKPLLLFFSIPEMRLFSMAVQFLLFAFVFMLGYRELGFAGVMGLTVCLLALNPLSTILSFHFADIMINVMISSIVIFTHHERLDEKDSWYLLFLMIGVATAFFDLMTYPLVSLGVPLILYLLLSSKNLKDNFIHVILFSVDWVAGYAGMWISKWLIGTVISGYNLVQDGLATVGYRSGGEVANIRSDYPYVLSQNMQAMFTRTLVAGLFLLAVSMIVLLLAGKLKFSVSLNRLIPVLFVGTYPFLWYFVIRNHSIVHVWFTHRALAVAVLAIASLPACFLSEKRKL